jgi:gentisate 1,2-dioxygenase
MTTQALATEARADAATPYTRRARYHCAENGFDFTWPPVPARQFLAERDRAFDARTPTGLIALDTAADLGTAYPVTTPALLVRYVKVRAGEKLRTQLVASGEIYYVYSGSGESRNGGDTIAWGAGDAFCFPGGGETVHRAGGEEALLILVTNEPLLAFEGTQGPAPGQARVLATHWPAAEIEKHFQAVWERPITANTTGHSVALTSTALASTTTTASINVAINSLAPGCDQRPHRHNGAAVTFALQGEGVYSLIDDQRVDWSNGTAQITPATRLHSHHNRGSQRMRSLVIQDEGLHYYTRTPGFSFD